MRNCPLLVCRAVLVCAPLVALLHPGGLHAQPVHTERDEHVVFDDDLLNADLGAPFGGRVFGSHLPPARTQLIRPRTNFIPELYESVAHL